MANRNINRLLNKKVWTGAEVGKALVASVIHDIKHQGDSDYTPLFTQEDFDRMEGSLIDEREIDIYGTYRDIYSGLVETYNQGQALHHQFFNGYYRYLTTVNDAHKAERAMAMAEHIPFVLTEEQYKEAYSKAEATLRASEETYISLLFSVLNDVVKNVGDFPDIPNEVIEALEATKKETVTNKRIIESYNIFHKRGYYKADDGTRSDAITPEEWADKTTRDFSVNHPFFNGTDGTDRDAFLKHIAKQRRIKAMEFFYKGIDFVKEQYKAYTGKALPKSKEATVMNYLEQVSLGREADDLYLIQCLREAPPDETQMIVQEILEDFTQAEWHYYSDIPEDITKYDILKTSLLLYIEGKQVFDENLFSEFIEDYPVLYRELDKYVRNLVPGKESITVDEFGKTIATCGELASIGVQRYKAFIVPDDRDIALELFEDEETSTDSYFKSARIALNGVVVAKNYKGDEAYKDNFNSVISFTVQDNLNSIYENTTKKEDTAYLMERIFLPALQRIYAFEELVKIIGSVYGIEGTDAVRIPSSLLEQRIGTLNSTIHLLYAEVYGTEAEKERKRGIIKELFETIDVEELKPTKDAIENVTRELQADSRNNERNLVQNFDYLITKLCERGL